MVEAILGKYPSESDLPEDRPRLNFGFTPNGSRLFAFCLTDLTYVHKTSKRTITIEEFVRETIAKELASADPPEVKENVPEDPPRPESPSDWDAFSYCLMCNRDVPINNEPYICEDSDRICDWFAREGPRCSRPIDDPDRIVDQVSGGPTVILKPDMSGDVPIVAFRIMCCGTVLLVGEVGLTPWLTIGGIRELIIRALASSLKRVRAAAKCEFVRQFRAFMEMYIPRSDPTALECNFQLAINSKVHTVH